MTGYPYYATIGECMEKGEQAGKDAWLAGLKKKDNPHVEEDYISRMFWFLGWELADATAKRLHNTKITASHNRG